MCPATRANAANWATATAIVRSSPRRRHPRHVTFWSPTLRRQSEAPRGRLFSRQLGMLRPTRFPRDPQWRGGHHCCQNSVGSCCCGSEFVWSGWPWDACMACMHLPEHSLLWYVQHTHFIFLNSMVIPRRNRSICNDNRFCQLDRIPAAVLTAREGNFYPYGLRRCSAGNLSPMREGFLFLNRT